MNSLKRNGYDFCKWYKEPSACHDCALIGNQDNGWGKGIYKVKDVPTIPVHERNLNQAPEDIRKMFHKYAGFIRWITFDNNNT